MKPPAKRQEFYRTKKWRSANWLRLVRVALFNLFYALFLLLICIPFFAIFEFINYYNLFIKRRHKSALLDRKGIGAIALWSIKNIIKRPVIIKGEVLNRLIEYSVALRMLEEAACRKRVIVDLGCGESYFPLILASKGYDVICLDTTVESAIYQRFLSNKFSKESAGRIHPIVASATHIPIRGNGINVSAISTIEHIQDDVSVFKEIGRLVAGDGKAVISFAYSDTPPNADEKAKKWELYKEYHPAYGPFNVHEKIITPSGCYISRSFFFRKNYWKRFYGRVSKLYVRSLISSMILNLLIGVPLIILDDIVSQDEKGHGWVFTLEPGGVAERTEIVLEMDRENSLHP